MRDYKKLAETIYSRKSSREYDDTSTELLEGDPDLMQVFSVETLVDDIKVAVRVLRDRQVKNDRSNYCLAFYSEDKPRYLENIGFIGQQIELELQAEGLGTCWWGMKKPSKEYKSHNGLDCVITMSAGVPKAVEKRAYPDGFKRNNADEIMIGNALPDRLIEAVRIAPSAVNLQPWLIEKSDHDYSFYLRQPKGIMEKLIGSMRHIDMGIAIAHFFVQAKANGLNLSFDFNGNNREKALFIAKITLDA
ncbi:MAG: hypothetical protein FWH42_03345 [Dehalococcoidia bacterium]|nr:hypothetical protein [Dehalococcoidia bacterium]